MKQPNSSSYITKQTAGILAFATFVVGFLGGVAFTVFKMPSPAITASQTVQDQQVANKAQMARALEAEVATDPNNVQAWIQLGHLYFDSGQHAKAIDAYERALALQPGDADVLTDLGVMYRRNGQPEKAIESFDRAIVANPEHQTALFNKGIVLLHDLDDQEGAIRSWERLLEINPLAMAANGQSVDELVTHYKKHVKN